MFTVAPDTRVRATASEAASLSFEGDPPSISVTSAVTGKTTDSIAVEQAPDLLDVSWEMDGVPVSACIEVVAARGCTLDQILGYRADQYRLRDLYEIDDGDQIVWDARARAEEVIEREAHRAMQPVIRRGWVDRPSCMTRSMVMCDDGYDPDACEIVSATMQDGSPADVSIVRSGPYVDVFRMPCGTAAEVVYRTGAKAMPPEFGPAVTALAAWYLAPRSEPENATTTSTEAGVLSFVIGGVDGAATSLPEVNALIQRYGRKDLKVG